MTKKEDRERRWASSHAWSVLRAIELRGDDELFPEGGELYPCRDGHSDCSPYPEGGGMCSNEAISLLLDYSGLSDAGLLHEILTESRNFDDFEKLSENARPTPAMTKVVTTLVDNDTALAFVVTREAGLLFLWRCEEGGSPFVVRSLAYSIRAFDDLVETANRAFAAFGTPGGAR